MQGDQDREINAQARRIEAAQGYLVLGMHEDAWMEVEAVDVDSLPDRRSRAAYLGVVLEIAVASGNWELGESVSRALLVVDPSHVGAYMHGAYCLHEMGKTESALSLLLSGPLQLVEKPLYHYNLGCYHAVLGEHAQAESCIREAIKLDPSLAGAAREDPDLKEVRL